MVNPNEFKDNEAHLYASFSVGGKGCINLDCSGFTPVSTDIPLGVASPKYSVKGGEVFGWNISIDRHNDDGNWWLSILSDQKHQIGYWPKGLFKNLAVVANQVEFGGEMNNPGGAIPLPSMGNGYFPEYNTQTSACFVHATVVDGSFNNVNSPDTEKFEDCNLRYTVLDGGFQDNPD
ncbi:hypothetical protein RND81_04G241300 [Saponaria officinalis]|uniref:Neprosin PEP catalytic domain-containing protein n=1 Tax=Saponaria officinalis TaxID=3572 RepID=A0AAW1LRM9_SAPOF